MCILLWDLLVTLHTTFFSSCQTDRVIDMEWPVGGILKVLVWRYYFSRMGPHPPSAVYTLNQLLLYDYVSGG